MEISRKEKYLILAISAGWLIYSLSLLGRSLWIDETITFWIASESFSATLYRSFNFHSIPPLYMLIENLVINISREEFFIRFPSFIFSILSVLFLYRLAKRLFNPAIAAYSSLFLLSSMSFISATVNARPYALGILAAILAITSIVIWIEENKTTDLLVFTLSAIVAILSHYLFATIILISLFIWVFYPNKDFAKKKFLPFLTALLFLVVPLLLGFVQLKQLRQTTVFYFQEISIWEVLNSLLYPPLFILLILCILRYRTSLLNFKDIWKKLSSSPLNILLLWFFVPPAVLYLAGLFTGEPLFQSRYILLSIPAYALVCAYLLCTLCESLQRLVVIILLQGVCVAMIFTHPPIINEDWRNTAKLLNEQYEEGKAYPVLLHSTLMESVNKAWLLDPKKQSYLRAPFSYYQIKNTQLNLPMYLTPTGETAQYLEQTLAPYILEHKQLFLVTRSGKRGLEHLMPWLTKKGFKAEPISMTDTVSLVLLKQEL